MADYWKSNERKHCEYCNCWIADNKPSIQFHENGKRHKLAVAKKLSDIGQKSVRDEKEKQKMDMQIRQMEEAAMKAYAIDICGGGDLTSQALNAKVAAASADYEQSTLTSTQSVPGPSALPKHAIDPLLPPIDVLEEEEREKHEKMKRVRCSNEIKDPSLWVEAKSEKEQSYFWNVKTGESVWKAPKEGYMTVEEYNRLNLVFEVKQKQLQHNKSKFMRENADEIAAKYKREAFKSLMPKETEEDEEEREKNRESFELYEPETAARPLGKWQTVAEKKAEPMNLELPKPMHEFKFTPVTSNEHEPPVKRFKEKIVTALDVCEGEVIHDSFRKRKIAKRNSRRRQEDDE